MIRITGIFDVLVLFGGKAPVLLKKRQTVFSENLTACARLNLHLLMTFN